MADLTTVGQGAPNTSANAWPVYDGGGTTGTNTSVASAAADTLLLVANVNRKGATIYNDSNTGQLYVLLGTTVASNANFTVLLDKAGGGPGIGGYYEVPFGYTGQIRGIWSVASGNARITEIT